jgi:TatD DNase family protein
MFVDTHCHLDCIVCFDDQNPILTPQGIAEAAKLIAEAKAARVSLILNVGCDVLSSRNSVQLARKFPEVFALVGIHPYEGQLGWKNKFAEIKQMLLHRTPADKIVGVGEIGLDYSRENTDKHSQQDLFKAQLELALEYNFAVSFHVRDAADDFLKIIEPYAKDVRGVIHCFQQIQEFADIVIGWGLLLGIDGPITYPKNNYLRELVKNLPLDYLILETDSPFLPVQNERGKVNYPAKIPLIAAAVAEIKQVNLQVVAAATTANATKLFSLETADFSSE